MNDTEIKTLNDAGINTEEALGRFAGNEKLFIKVLNKFLNDTNFEDYNAALEAGEIENAEQSLHAFKGIAGNLGINEVYELAAEIDSGLKEGTAPDAHKKEMLKKAYDIAIAAIAKLEDS